MKDNAKGGTSRFGALEVVWSASRSPVGPANTLCIHGERTILVDPGASTEIETEAVRCSPDAAILLTHYHGDHRAGTKAFPDLPVWSHRADAPAIESHDTLLEWTIGLEDPEAIEEFKKLLKPWDMDCRDVGKRLDDGDLLDTDAARVRVVHLPGHTPGHIGLYFEEEDLLYTTDMNLAPVGPWYGNEAASLSDLEDTLKRLADFDASLFFAAHGQKIFPKEEFREKLVGYSGVVRKIDDMFIRRISEAPTSAEDLARMLSSVFPTLSPVLKFAFAGKLARKHLERLVEAGEVAEEDGLYRVC